MPVSSFVINSTVASATAVSGVATSSAVLPSTGGDVPAYVHTQTTPATTWSVAHNRGAFPSVEVISVGGAEVVAEVQHISVNVTEVRFAVATAGTARFT